MHSGTIRFPFPLINACHAGLPSRLFLQYPADPSTVEPDKNERKSVFFKYKKNVKNTQRMGGGGRGDIPLFG